MSNLDLIKLAALMNRTSGRPEVRVGLIDGPVFTQHGDLATEQVEVAGDRSSACTHSGSAACLHGTFIAGILFAKRDSEAPAICPDCTFLLCPILLETASGRDSTPSATPRELADAIHACIAAGARVINLSLSLARPSTKEEQTLDEALDHAMRLGVLIIAAAGNQGTVGSSALTRHPAVIPIVAYDVRGRPLPDSNLGSSIGRRGLGAPGDSVTSLRSDGHLLTLSGTSAAVPFVTGAIALLWSEYPDATAMQIKLAIMQTTRRRVSVAPPLLDAEAAYQSLLSSKVRGDRDEERHWRQCAAR